MAHGNSHRSTVIIHEDSYLSSVLKTLTKRAIFDTMRGTMAGKKVLLSGIQPSGRLHIGNYFGAIKQFVDLQEQYDTYVSIVNYHAMTTLRDPKELRENTLNAVIDHLALGLDPQKMTLFIQSDLLEVTELAWIFNNLVTVPYLSRAHAYKDKVAKGKEATVGLFDYPVLMAADILIMKADVVPVGKDNQQHVEITREIAEKFNHHFGETFPVPEWHIPEDVAVVPGTDGEKMGKSDGNVIPLFATRDEIEKAVLGIVTDSDGERPENVYAIHKLFKNEKELKKLYEEHKGKYKALKDALIEDIDVFMKPLRECREEIAKNKDDVLQILENGAEKARSHAMKTMHEVREKVGLKF